MLNDLATRPDATLKTRQRSIPSLDGLRAISISLVILAHYLPPFERSPLLKAYLFQLGELGVSVFFVISGFLITFLLCEEHAQTSDISLKHFYQRRCWRIFPPFYVYLVVCLLLRWAGVVSLKPIYFVIAAIYLWNYYMPPNGGILSSTWSLALEEQFYLFWPLCLKLLKPARAVYCAILLIVLEPLVRVATYFLYPRLQATGKISAMFHTRIDTIMFGCLLALVWHHRRFLSFVRSFLRFPAFSLAVVFLLSVEPLLNVAWRSVYHGLWFTLNGFAISVALIYLVQNPSSRSGQFMNQRWIRYMGRLSYSIYLWQQMFVDVLHRWFPFNLLAALGCACASYYFVELPSLRLRNRFMHSHLPGT